MRFKETSFSLKTKKSSRQSSFSENRNTVVAVGVAPTIQTLRISASSTALRASSTTVNQNIAQNKEKSSSSEIIERKNFEEKEQSNLLQNLEAKTIFPKQLIQKA